MNTNEMADILADVKFGDWDIGVYFDATHGSYLQVSFLDEDNYNPGKPYRSKGRKWLLSRHMTKSEVVLTAWKAVLTAIEHEAREKFLYRGKMIFGPHIDVDALVMAADWEDVRA